MVHLVRSGGRLRFQPSVAKFEEQLLGAFERIISAVQKLKRAETRVFLDWPGRAQYLKVGGTPSEAVLLCRVHWSYFCPYCVPNVPIFRSRVPLFSDYVDVRSV